MQKKDRVFCHLYAKKGPIMQKNDQLCKKKDLKKGSIIMQEKFHRGLGLRKGVDDY